MGKNFWKYVAYRALRTVCQTAVATIGTSFVLTDCNWGVVVSASILAGILSVLTSIATGLPEIDLEKSLWMNIDEPTDSEVDDDEE